MGELTLKEIKDYLRLDSDEEDNLLQMLCKYSKEEIEASTGIKNNEAGNSETYKLAQLIIIADRYENRGSAVLEFKPNNILSCLYTKLKYT